MAILVLGGAGYIGSHTVYELIDAGREVVVADNLQTGFRAAVHPKAKFYQLDIRDKGALDTLFQAEHIEGVIHFAASSQVGESMSDPLKYYDNNLHGTMVLLKSMVEHGVDKIVFSSTAATYGEPERVPILEDDKTVPTNCYGQTKLAMEHMMGWVSKAHGLRYVALRYFNACGAHPSGAIGEAHNPETHLIPIILQVPLGQREAVSIFGDDYPTYPGPGLPAQWRGQQRVQPGQRCGLHGEGSGGRGPGGHRPPHSGQDCPPPGGRPGPAHRLLREGHPGAGLEASVQRPEHHRGLRLGLAQEPPPRL